MPEDQNLICQSCFQGFDTTTRLEEAALPADLDGAYPIRIGDGVFGHFDIVLRYCQNHQGYCGAGTAYFGGDSRYWQRHYRGTILEPHQTWLEYNDLTLKVYGHTTKDLEVWQKDELLDFPHDVRRTPMPVLWNVDHQYAMSDQGKAWTSLYLRLGKILQEAVVCVPNMRLPSVAHQMIVQHSDKLSMIRRDYFTNQCPNLEILQLVTQAQSACAPRMTQQTTQNFIDHFTRPDKVKLTRYEWFYRRQTFFSKALTHVTRSIPLLHPEFSAHIRRFLRFQPQERAKPLNVLPGG